MFARRRATVVLATVAVVASSILWAAPAYAACTSVPGSTPGFNVGVGGDTQRIPGISNIQVCSSGTSIPGARTSTAGNGACDSSCLTLYVLGGDADGGAVTVHWREDGSSRQTGLDPGGVGGGNEICVLSVGIPFAPVPGCNLALGIGDPGPVPTPGPLPTVGPLPTPGPLPTADPNPIVDDVERLLEEVPSLSEIEQEVEEVQQQILAEVQAIRDDVTNNPVCNAIPPQQQPWGEDVEFCDSPGAWAQIFCETNPDACDGTVLWRLICETTGVDRPQCPEDWE